MSLACDRVHQSGAIHTGMGRADPPADPWKAPFHDRRRGTSLAPIPMSVPLLPLSTRPGP